MTIEGPDFCPLELLVLAKNKRADEWSTHGVELMQKFVDSLAGKRILAVRIKARNMGEMDLVCATPDDVLAWIECDI